MDSKVISDEFIHKVTDELKEGKGIRYGLPGGGLIHIDRPLPFLVVYRYPRDRKDRYTHQLIRSEASCLIASGHHDDDLKKLVKEITRTLSEMNGAFLIIEVWKGEEDYSETQRTKIGSVDSSEKRYSQTFQSVFYKTGLKQFKTELQPAPLKAGTWPAFRAKSGTYPASPPAKASPSAKASPPSAETGTPPAKAGTSPARTPVPATSAKTVHPKPAAPVFRLMAPAQVDFSSVKNLKTNLEELSFGVLPVTAVILSGQNRHPKDLPPLLERDELKAMESLLIGMEISPFYINPETGESFPLMLRKLTDGLSLALKKTFYEFVRIQTRMPVKHYQMLGRRTVSQSTWDVDESLARINDSFRFLLLVTPINIAEAWQQFRESRYERTPEFHYRLMPVDPDVLKRELYNIPIERVVDPALSRLFRDKQRELDKILTLLSDRGKRDFMLGSLQLYGRLDDSLTRIAEGLLASIPPASTARSGDARRSDQPHSNGGNGGQSESRSDSGRDPSEHTAGRQGQIENHQLISPEEFADLARREIGYYREQYPDIDAEVFIQGDVVGMLVSSGNLYIGRDARIERDRAGGLIQHEVGTHILTYYNGRAQPLKQLYCGVPGYEELQEGLAVMSEYLVGGLTPSRLRLLAARVVAVQAMLQEADYIETFRLLHNRHQLDESEAFTTTMRVFRGGGLTKDAIYLKGLVRLLAWLGEGRSLEPLLIGKIHEEYVPLMQELLYRRILKPVPIRPRYFDNSASQARLEELKSGKSVMNLV